MKLCPFAIHPVKTVKVYAGIAPPPENKKSQPCLTVDIIVYILH